MKGLMVFVLLAYGQILFAQRDTTILNPRVVVIEKVTVEGNDRTDRDIITREMSVKKLDTISYTELKKRVVIDRENIFNTTLFNTVEILINDINYNRVELIVRVDERWYTFPAPILELVDRNFNDWWENHNHDFSRLNYGMFLFQKNVRGRNETIKLLLQAGYTKQVGISYLMPYLDKAQKNGLEVIFSYSENNNIAFKTEDHLREFVDRDFPIYSELAAVLSYTHRKTFDTYHTIDLNYFNRRVDQLVQDLNSDFFSGDGNRQIFFSLGYNFRHDKRDVVAYPTNGYVFDFNLKKVGLGIYNDVDFATTLMRFSKYFDLGNGFYIDNHSVFYKNWYKKLSYNNYTGLGYSPYDIRGYELYIIESDRYFLNKSSLKKRIFSTEQSFDWVPLEQFRHFPLNIYLKTFFDFGNTNNINGNIENTSLANKWIYGTGVGLDISTAYDVVLRLEYSINDRKEKGFFFHLKKEF